MTISNFSDLGLAEPIQRALIAKNYITPTPIQTRAIPELLKGKDVLGIAQTGTGKTAAFALPILQRLSRCQGKRRARSPRALILAPTRELAIQIGDRKSTRLNSSHVVISYAVFCLKKKKQRSTREER